PGNRRVWEPLVTLLRAQNDHEKLLFTVHAAVDAIDDPRERCNVRVAHARYLMSLEGREPDAAEVLRVVLDELPDHSEAAELLADVYERTGFDEDLVELLNRQLDVAREGGDLEAFRAASIRLGALLASVNREQAMAVYRNALELLPEDRELALALLELFGPDDDPRERAEI